MRPCFGEKNPDFRFNRMRKSGKTKFFEVHIESALITHLITALFFTFRTFSAACTHIQLNIFITHVKYLFLSSGTNSIVLPPWTTKKILWKFNVHRTTCQSKSKISYRQISCSKYGKAFISVSKVKIHERIHTGEKPFSC